MALIRDTRNITTAGVTEADLIADSGNVLHIIDNVDTGLTDRESLNLTADQYKQYLNDLGVGAGCEVITVETDTLDFDENKLYVFTQTGDLNFTLGGGTQKICTFIRMIITVDGVSAIDFDSNFFRIHGVIDNQAVLYLEFRYDGASLASPISYKVFPSISIVPQPEPEGEVTLNTTVAYDIVNRTHNLTFSYDGADLPNVAFEVYRHNVAGAENGVSVFTTNAGELSAAVPVSDIDAESGNYDPVNFNTAYYKVRPVTNGGSGIFSVDEAEKYVDYFIQSNIIAKFLPEFGITFGGLGPGEIEEAASQGGGLIFDHDSGIYMKQQSFANSGFTYFGNGGDAVYNTLSFTTVNPPVTYVTLEGFRAAWTRDNNVLYSTPLSTDHIIASSSGTFTPRYVNGQSLSTPNSGANLTFIYDNGVDTQVEILGNANGGTNTHTVASTKTISQFWLSHRTGSIYFMCAFSRELTKTEKNNIVSALNNLWLDWNFDLLP